MKKSSEILRLGKDDPRYLDSFGHMCFLLGRKCEEGDFTFKEYDDTVDCILEAIKPRSLLHRHLVHRSIISQDTNLWSAEYATAAHAFWEDLITKLEAEGK